MCCLRLTVALRKMVVRHWRINTAITVHEVECVEAKVAAFQLGLITLVYRALVEEIHNAWFRS